MNVPKMIEQNGQRVLTTAQLAESYGTDGKTISWNFCHNKQRYTEGKHYFVVTGDALRAIRDFHELPKNVNKLYLWTERGALLHAKSLNTDKAWEVYDFLVEHYFRSVTMNDIIDMTLDDMQEKAAKSKQHQIGELRQYHSLTCTAAIAKAKAEIEQIKVLDYLASHPALAESVSIPMLEKQGAKT